MTIAYTRLRDADRQRVAEALRLLADEITAPHARRVQQTITDAATIGMPSKASGVEGSPGNQVEEDDDGKTIMVQPDTATESAALHPDPVAQQALADMATLTQMAALVGPSLSALSGYNPDRPVTMCPRCGNPFDRSATRCQRRDETGRLCGSSDEHQPYCKNRHCGDVLVVGKIRDGRCGKCAKFWERNQREWFGKGGLEIGDDVEVIDGVAHV